MEDMRKNKEEMLDKKTWVVVGVTPKKERFGYKIWKILKKHNYKSYGVNPKYHEIEGEAIYSSVLDLPEKADVLDMVVGPSVAIETLDEAKKAGIEYIWFQPGSFDEKVIEKAKEMNFKILYNDCVYAQLKSL